MYRTKDASFPAIETQDLHVTIKGNKIIEGLNLKLYQNEILGLIGSSGGGKSVLMRTILGLLPKEKGTIKIYNQNVDELEENEKKHYNMLTGVLFQHGALFSSLSVLENLQLPMRRYLNLPEKLLNELARLKLAMVGLSVDVAEKSPVSLSGGMIKRVALARALALDPKIIFLDEPTAGLDPIGAAAFDILLKNLRDTLGLSIFMITHDLDSLYTICDRIAVLGSKRIIAEGTIEELQKNEDKWIKSYFHGTRARNIIRQSNL